MANHPHDRATDGSGDIAVIGLGAVFPGAPDVRTFWENITTGRDCIEELPESRSDLRFLDPTSSAIDRIPTRRAGFIGESVRFEAGTYGIMPVAALGAEPDQMLALAVASAALTDAGYADRDFDRSRAAVILGRGGYLTPGLVRLHRKVHEAEQLVSVLRDVMPGVSEAQLSEVKRRFQEAAGPYGPDTAIGLVPNLAASRIANRLDLQGPAYTVDAACASSLIAVEHGMRELREGRCELALVGGVHLTHDIAFWSVFAQLGALSSSGSIRPFDRRADGLLIGEGVGVLALKRLDAARRDGDRIYATLAGIGSSSDGRAASVMVPRVAGQVLALRRAWADAGLDPASVRLIEAHGTATAAGDGAELRTLLEVFGPREVALGSVKSMIGHAMPAAGAAGLIKAVLAVHHGIVPPSLHCEEPNPLLAGTGWSVPSVARDWDGPRVAGVNAFGFGGINAHVVVRAESEPVSFAPSARRPADRADVAVLALAAESPEALLEALDSGRLRGGTGPCRVALVDPTPERVARARDIVARWKPWAGRRGIWFRPKGLLADGKGSLAFVYPGIEASFEPDTASLAEHFRRPAPGHLRPADLEAQGRGVVGLARWLTEILTDLGIRPAHIAGHSVGEWSAMIAAGALSGADVDAFLDRVPMGSLEVPGVLFAAAACDRAVADEVIADLEGIAVSHDNCPHQILLCGHDAPIAIARDRLVARGVICQILPFRSGFHSPLFADYLGPHVAHLASLPMRAPNVPLWSATLADRFPAGESAMRQVALDHLTSPLRWRELVLRLHDAGARVFVQVGTGSLPGFIRDTLDGRPHHAMSVLEPRRDGLVELRNTLLALFVEGLDVPLDRLTPPAPVSVALPLGNPLVRMTGLTLGTSTDLPDASEPVRDALQRTLDALRAGPTEVVAALNARRTAVDRRVLSVQTVPALIDHTFFPQPPGWEVVSDRHPVVPMTMMLDLLVEIAEQLAPGQVAVEIDQVEALRWLIVWPPVEVELRARRDGAWIRAEIVGYAGARVRFAPRWPAGSRSMPALVEPRPSPCSAARLYEERWMFHGPRYQGITELGSFDATGIDGVITVPAGPGALLDNAGQLLGYWLMASVETDHLAMPVGMESVRFFGPTPAVGVAVECRVRITDVGPRSLVGDVELSVDGVLWCRITRWADHRFQTDPLVWDVMRKPEFTRLSEDRGRFWLFDDTAHRAPSRDWLMRRYLNEAEREQLAASRTPRQMLNDRIVAADALRAAREAAGSGPLFPIEARADGWFVSFDHHGPVSVAVAGRRAVGIGLDPDPAAALSRAQEVAGREGPAHTEELPGGLHVAVIGES